MHQLVVIEGDGIGKEVIPAAVEVLWSVVPDLEPIPAEAGWECFQRKGNSVPEETLELVQAAGAALFGAVSSPSHKVEGYRSAVISLRQKLNLYANLRPVRTLPQVSPRAGVDLIVVRENTEGLYAGRERLEGNVAVAERVISRAASRRIAVKAVELLKTRHRKRLTIVHKANILPVTDGLFRDSVMGVVNENRKAGDDWTVDELLVDTAAMKMASEPEIFDVIVTTNLFGDILSDIAAPWCGGLGLAPSLNWGDQLAVAEPVHGSAPDIAGKKIANPIAAILSGALLARYHWGLTDVADRIEAAVVATLSEGKLDALGTEAIKDLIISNLT